MLWSVESLLLGVLMKKTLLTSVAGAAVLAAAPAMAADLATKAPRVAPVVPPVPVFSWTGCYIGAHTGWGWGHKDVHNNFTSDHAEGSDVDTLTGRVKTSGPIFGGQLGCDFQFAGAFVLGVQGSLSAADINGDEKLGVSAGTNLRAKTDGLASVVGRLGWAGWSTVLFYVEGGGAWAHDRFKLTCGGDYVHPCDNQYGAGFESWTESRSGWVIGAGIEWAFAPSWTAFVQYDHYDFGSKPHTININPGINSVSLIDIKQRIDTVRVGLNYRFNLFGGGIGKGKAPVTARY
jgi:outer membrane immunogenic protein